VSDLVLAAISFAARAHRHQLRKDGETPYAAHPMRVLFIARDVFGATDPRLLATAALHDTLEDTTTDCDDLIEQFGPDVAKWVAALTKDKRLPDEEREKAYGAALLAGGPPVILCKLADMYDNLSDCGTMPEAKRAKTFARIRQYLDILNPGVTAETAGAFVIVEAKWKAAQ
jgi:(p)ppGpp synthase/HD superfamily hydrolase